MICSGNFSHPLHYNLFVAGIGYNSYQCHIVRKYHDGQSRACCGASVHTAVYFFALSYFIFKFLISII